ncbi:MAG: hypothetical protein JXA97_03805 [Anaerolineales bacterium]|nr:hypothetical protein [Anaerolineales bacterium]
MPLKSRQRTLYRRQRRVNKLRKLKAEYRNAEDAKTRKRVAEKIARISPWAELPEG